MEKYKCIKGFSVPVLDGDGFETDDVMLVEVGEIWSMQDYPLFYGEIRLTSDDFEWIEISKDTLKDCFELAETEQEWYRKYIYEETDDCELIKQSVKTGIGKPNFKDGKCEGYCHSENDDEPLDKCKRCKIFDSYGIE